MDTTNNKERNQLVLRKEDLIKALIIFGITLAAITLLTVIKFLFIDGSSAVNPIKISVSVGMGFAFLMLALLIYVFNSRKRLVYKSKTLAAICCSVTVSYLICTYVSILDIYIMPVALTAFLIAPLTERRDAFVSNLIMNVMLAFSLMLENYFYSKELTFSILTMFITGIITGTLVSYSVSNDTKRLTYIWRGLLIGLLGAAMIAVSGAIFPEIYIKFTYKLPYVFIALVGQVVLGLMLQPIFESVFNLITNSRLVELTDHNSPLIKRLISEAPGTFNHSLAVANFAEICAGAIGENPYLARACAYYHDVGKMINPLYFKENQADYNPHDEVLPEVSADIIRNHTTEGLKLCNEYRIPEEVSHVTIQHHGTLPIAVFYNKAKSLTDREVDVDEYSYHGVTPISKVAAIIMLCDSGEAAIRAMDKPNGENVDKLLKGLINARIAAGQFDNCDISLRDLDIIRQTIINAYGGLFHKRMQYPDGKTNG